jgi:hypothetical protein
MASPFQSSYFYGCDCISTSTFILLFFVCTNSPSICVPFRAVYLP